MLLPRLGALLSAATTAHAFQNTSPFFLVSSQPLHPEAPLRSSQIALTKDVEDKLIESLGPCDQKWYRIFTQDSVRADDFSTARTPKLRDGIASVDGSNVIEIPEVAVMGELSARSIQTRLEKACSAQGKKRVDSSPEQDDEYCIVETRLPGLPSETHERAKAISGIDGVMGEIVDSVLQKDSATVLIYITTPPQEAALDHQDGHIYEYDDPYPSAPHTDLKRDLRMYRRQADDDNMQAGLPLFERYQFLSPAIFMGLTVSLLLLSILYVGMRAISGLEISVMAFSKEMGPQAAQRGKQQ